MKNLTVKIFVGLFVVATVLLQSCKKDSETYSFLLNERGAFVEEPGGTTSLGFTAINISSVTPTTVPQGWSVTVDMNERRISVTAPTTFPDDPKTLADGEEEEEENTNVRFGTVYLTGRSSGGSSVSTSLYVSLAETVKARRNEQRINLAQIRVSRHRSLAAQRFQKMLKSDYIAASCRRKSELSAHAFFAGER